jgi:hypothetical protein
MTRTKSGSGPSKEGPRSLSGRQFVPVQPHQHQRPQAKPSYAQTPEGEPKRAVTHSGHSEPSSTPSVWRVGGAALAAAAAVLGGATPPVPVPSGSISQALPTRSPLRFNVNPAQSDSNVDAIANGLASAVHDATPQEKDEAEGIVRVAINAVWSEFESVMKDVGHDALKELAKAGLAALVLNSVLRPLLRLLGRHPDNRIASEIEKRLEAIEKKLEAEPHAQINEQNVAVWINVSPAQAELYLRAMKLQKIDDRWSLDTSRRDLWQILR